MGKINHGHRNYEVNKTDYNHYYNRFFEVIIDGIIMVNIVQDVCFI